MKNKKALLIVDIQSKYKIGCNESCMSKVEKFIAGAKAERTEKIMIALKEKFDSIDIIGGFKDKCVKITHRILMLYDIKSTVIEEMCF